MLGKDMDQTCNNPFMHFFSGNLITTIYHIHDVLRVFITTKSCSTLTKFSNSLTYQESYFQHACTSDDTFYNRVK